MPAPSVGRIVHYVSYGTPGGEHRKECRAAIITEVGFGPGGDTVGLCVLNPTGQFFNQGVTFHDGSGEPGRDDCTQKSVHGSPFRYCQCGWTEDEHLGGTWHWPERSE